jgi:transglutaminase-like putative cysteine protease
MNLGVFSNIRRGWIDFLLCGICGIMVTYSTGMSVASPRLALFFSALVAIGTLASFLIFLKFSSSALVRNSVWLYVVVALACPFLAGPVNDSLPDGGFPRELLFSAVPLVWMVALGSFVAWVDGSLTFQSVPCIALFGLVGAFNTFAGATVAFFIFLVSAASLYSRTHQRHMLERAEQSGMRNIEAIKNGPWRWMAGPEWALGSAAAIIILSLIGAPVLQESVRTVAGQVRITPPRVQPPVPTTPIAGTVGGERSPIGTGPRGELSDEVVLRIKMDKPRYLRTAGFGQYLDGSWLRVPPPTAMGAEERRNRFRSPNRSDLELNFERQTFVSSLQDYPFDKFPVPTPFWYADPGTGLQPEFDGSVAISSPEPRTRLITGTFFARREEAIPSKAIEETNLYIDFFLKTDSFSPRVVELARSIRTPTMTDYEAALALKQEIGRRAKYNLQAAATPVGADPVDHFLFGPVREGYCDLFASSMVQMARAIGIPARYTNGFYPTQNERDERGYFLIRKADYHAWAELYFDGFGWMPFDPTEDAEAVPGGERGSAKDTIPWHRGNALKIIGNGVLGLVAALGMFLIVRATKVGSVQADHIANTLSRAYSTYVGALSRFSGESMRPAEAPAEFLERVRKLLPDEVDAEAILRRFEAAFYGPVSPRLIDSQELLEEASNFASRLRGLSRPGDKQPRRKA